MHTSMAHIAAWKASELSRADYCRAQGIHYSTFSYWLSCAAQQEVEQGAACIAGSFIALTGQEVASPSQGQWRAELPNGVVLHFEQAPDVSLLKMLSHVGE